MPPDATVGDQFAELLEFCRHYLLTAANAELPAHLRAKGGASDLVQNTLFAAHQYRYQFAGRTVGDLRVWLRGILANELAMFRRRYLATAARSVNREVPVGEAAAQACDLGSSPLAELVREEESRRVTVLLVRLPDDMRQVVVLRLNDGLTFGAIGVILGKTEEAARKLFVRALDRLRVAAPSAAA